MIARIRGRLVKKGESKVIVDVDGVFFEINIPPTVYPRLDTDDGVIELVIYHYLNMEGNRAIPMMIGFIDELEREFFEKFITISGIGPKAALKAFAKPVAAIATAIEEGDITFLKTLAGIGNQKARQIVAFLQGKVGRFALIKGRQEKLPPQRQEFLIEAKQILKRLQYSAKEIEEMVNHAIKARPEIENIEDLLNEIYRQRR